MELDNCTSEPPYKSLWGILSRIPFRHGWIDAGGVRTRYIEAGEQNTPVVIFVHGTAGSLEAFSENLEAHASRFHCFAIDLIGSGYTAKPDVDYEIAVYVDHIRRFMDATGIAAASFVGVSLGSWIAARFALTYPAITTSITLLSAAGLVANASTMKQIKSMRTNAVENPTWENIKAVLNNLLHRKHKLIDDLINVRQAIYRQPGMPEAMAHTLCLQAPEIRARNLLTEQDWRAITSRTLVVGSLQDHGDYLGTARYVADVMPNAQYVEMQDVGHWPQYEDSETFNQINIEFLLKNE